MLIQLTTPQWLSLPNDVRQRLKKVFNIPRSEGTRVEDNKVLSDGHNHRDLAVITVESMQSYLGQADPADSFFDLFDQVLAKVGDELAVVAEQPKPAPVAAPAEDMFIQHNGKTYKLTEVAAAPQPPLVAITPSVSQPQAKAKAGRAKPAARGGAKKAK